METRKIFTKWLFIIVMVVAYGSVSAHEGCGFIPPKFETSHANQRIESTGCEPVDTNQEVFLPVVIHVLNPTANNLISKVQVDSAMARLNRDFANANGYGPDTRMRFVLAKRDPNGVATNGINYIDGRNLPGYVEYGMQYDGNNGVSVNYLLNNVQWPKTQYINVYIAHKYDQVNFSVAGFAGFNDLLTVRSDIFVNKDRTFGHEMGHYFNLYHVYSNTADCFPDDDCNDQGDRVCDTPPVLFTDIDSSSCYHGDASNSIFNIMGSGSNVGKDRFTQGQKEYMRSFLFNLNLYYGMYSLMSSDGLVAPSTTNEVCLVTIDNNGGRYYPDEIDICNGLFVPQITIKNLGANIITALTVETYIDGVLGSATQRTGLHIPSGDSSSVFLDTLFVSEGDHNVMCMITKVNNVQDYLTTNNKACKTLEFVHSKYYVSPHVTNNELIGHVITSGEGLYPCGDTAVFSAYIDSNNVYLLQKYEFDGWYYMTILISRDNPYRFVPSETYPIYGSGFIVRFKVRNYSLNVTSMNTTHGTVQVTQKGNNQVLSVPITGLAQTEYVLKAFSKSGYQFIGWYKDGQLHATTATITITLNGNQEYVAHFAPSTQTITITSNNNDYGRVSLSGNTTSGSIVTVSAIPNSCYEFLRWEENGMKVSTDASYSFTVSGNRNLVAIFAVKWLTITITSATGGTTLGAGTYTCGNMVTVTAQPQSCYVFLHWKENNVIVSTNASYKFSLTGDRTLVPIYTQKSFTVSIGTVIGGNTDGEGNYVCGKTAIVTANADPCYTFTHWEENGNIVSFSASYQFSVTTNRHLVPVFMRNMIQINAIATTGGTVENQENFFCGDLATIIASADSGYQFLHWKESGVVIATDSILTFTTSHDRNITAVFDKATGMFNTIKPQVLNIYPNPATAFIRVGQSGTCSIVDMQGLQVVPSRSVQADEYISIGELPVGVYIVTLVNREGETSIAKLVRQ